MSLKLRVTLFISIVFMLLAVSLFVVFNMTLMDGFLELEKEGALRNTERTFEAIKNMQVELANKVEEWGAWDDTYNYIQNKKKSDYEKSNLTFEGLDQLGFKHFIMFDLSGKVLKSLYVDQENSSLDQIEKDKLEVFREISVRTLAEGQKISGIINFNNINYLVGAAPITNSDANAPIMGVLIITRNFGKEELDKVKDLTKLNIFIGSLNLNSFENQIKAKIENVVREGKGDLIYTEDKIYCVDVIKDILDRPLDWFVVDLNRQLLNKGIQARDLVTLYILTFTVIALMVALFYLNKIVIHPLQKIASETKQIGENQLENIRVKQEGDREIRTLATSINLMLDTISKAHNEIKVAQNHADAANAAKSTFISRVSHELRTPVAGIIGINRMIKKQPGLTRAVKELVEMCDKTAHSLISIIGEILDLIKAESGELTFEKIEFQPRQVIRDVMLVMSGRLEGKYNQDGNKKRLQFVCDVDPNIPDVLLGDPVKLKQVLVNLLGNAIKFTAEGEIGLRAKLDKFATGRMNIKFEIWDTGLGIPQEKLGTIFVPFKQADETISRRFQGTGLGLSIVKQFVEGLGGNVKVESEVGKGSVFTVQLSYPLVGRNEYSLLADKHKIKINKPAIFVASNSNTTSTLIKNLNLMGFHVIHVDNSSEQELSSKENEIRNAEVLLLDEDALEFSMIEKIVKARAEDKTVSTIPIIQPASVQKRDALYELGLEYVLNFPVLADDIILAYLGKLKKVDFSDDTSDEALRFKKKLRVLIVDDIATNRMILEDMLQEVGHEVICLSDGTEMVERLKPMINGDVGAETFDIVLTDVSMPVMDGDVATKIIREMEGSNNNKVHVPIVAVTAHSLREEQDKIRNAGVDGLLVKPLRPEKVASEFVRLLTSLK